MSKEGSISSRVNSSSADSSNNNGTSTNAEESSSKESSNKQHVTEMSIVITLNDEDKDNNKSQNQSANLVHCNLMHQKRNGYKANATH